MATSETAFFQSRGGGWPGVTNETAGGMAVMAAGGLLAVVQNTTTTAYVTVAGTVLYGIAMIVKAWIERDGKRKDARIDELETELYGGKPSRRPRR